MTCQQYVKGLAFVQLLPVTLVTLILIPTGTLTLLGELIIAMHVMWTRFGIGKLIISASQMLADIIDQANLLRTAMIIMAAMVIGMHTGAALTAISESTKPAITGAAQMALALMFHLDRAIWTISKVVEGVAVSLLNALGAMLGVFLHAEQLALPAIIMLIAATTAVGALVHKKIFSNRFIMIYKGIKEIIEKLENSKAPFLYFILTFFFAVLLRNFLEISPNFDALKRIMPHYTLSYIASALILIILFHLATKEKIEKISRVILPCYLILISVPILDFIFSLGKGFTVGYMYPGRGGYDNMLLRFFTFFGPIETHGITIGMRIEIALALIGCFIYFFIKKRSVIRSLIFSFFTYSLIFLFCSMPYVMRALLNISGLEYDYSDPLAINFYLLLIFIFSVWLFYLYNKTYFIAFFKDIRPFRILHFQLMFVLGVVLAKVTLPIMLQLTEETLFHYPFIMIAILFAALFTITTNNIVDYDIDKESNKERPLVSGTIPITHYKSISWIFLLLAVVYSSAVDFRTLFLILVVIGNYFLYSMPPLRLKRIPFFSKLLISINSFVFFFLGYGFASGTPEIPVAIIVFFLVAFTAAINFIDIKDYEGDKKAGIKTLPTMLGLKKSKLIIGLFFLIAYIIPAFIFNILRNIPFLTSSIIFGLTEFSLINRKNYNEKPVFIVYLSSIILLIVYLILL